METGDLAVRLVALLVGGLLLVACDQGGLSRQGFEPTQHTPQRMVVATQTEQAPSATPTLTDTPVPPTPTATPTETAEPTPRAAYNTPGDHVVNVLSGEDARSFLLHVPPSYEPGVLMPLVLSLHGLGSNAIEQARLSQMSAKADEEGFIVVYPQALGAPANWNLGTGPFAMDDVVFLRDLIDFLWERMSIDSSRVYVTGFSNGGGMASRLGCLLADRVAAIAPVSGAYLNWQSCRPHRPMPVIAFHGTEDPIVPFEGDAFLPAVDDWAQAWGERNGCDPLPSRTNGYESVSQLSWENCDAGGDVTLYSIVGGGHRWPGSTLLPRQKPGAQDFVATDLIWAFFQAHALP